MDQLGGNPGMLGSNSESLGGAYSTNRWTQESGPKQHLLVKDMLRHGVRLYGTRWCLNCSEQKAMLYQLASERSNWKTMYVDCDLLLNSLETAFIKQVPAWKVGNEYHLGMQSEGTLRTLLDRVGGQKKQWKTGGASQWQRRHRQRALWAKQEYAVLVKEAIARGKAAAAADKATHRITPQMAEMHPPQPAPRRSSSARATERLPGVPMGSEAGTHRHHMPPPSTAPSATHVPQQQQAIRARPFSPESLRNQLRLHAPFFPPLHERFPFLAQWRDMRTKSSSGAAMESAQDAWPGSIAPLGWFRDRFSDADYGQLFETVAKIRLLALPPLLTMPHLLRPAFARASSAVEAAGFDFRPQEFRPAARRRVEGTSSRSRLQGDGGFRGWETPQVVAALRVESVRAHERGQGSTSGSRRPWWRSIFPW